MKQWVLLILGTHYAHVLCNYYAARAQVEGFQSLDCGSESTSVDYTDTDSDIIWTPDSLYNMNPGGTAANVQPPSSANFRRYTTIRYFVDNVHPAYNHSKFCYVLPNTTPSKFYLVRASFWLGYDPPIYFPGATLIQFKLLINADLWDDVSISLPQSDPLLLEIYVQAIHTSIAVCLSGPESGFSFISALELRPLDDNMYFLEYNESRALRLLWRINYGPPATDLPVRYRNDSLDRIWCPQPPAPGVSTILTTQTAIDTNVNDLPPSPVMQTAIVAVDSGGITLYFALRGESGNHLYFHALYFAEIDARVNSSGQRNFGVQMNGDPFVEYVDAFNEWGSDSPTEWFNSNNISLDWMNFTLSPTAESIYPPFIAAAEIFEWFDSPMSNGTFYTDLVSINNVSASLSNLSSYRGDPCLPFDYGYPWVTCNLSTAPPRVINISLSSRALVGEIPTSFNALTALVAILLDGNHLEGQIPDLSELTNLQVLNLSNNKLSGAIPDFLSKLSNLQYLYLQNNNFSGPIPVSLLERKFIQFDYSGNDLLCTKSNTTCYVGSQGQTSQNNTLKIGVSVLGACIFLVLSGVFMTIAYRRRTRKRNTHSATASINDNLEKKHVIGLTEMVEASNVVSEFSYQEIQAATNNFLSKLGEGGFGDVYEGKLANGHPVAIKVLKGDSQEGARQILNELNLLSRVHHKNLVSLLGYCTERKLMLIYEYMSNGSLEDLLYGQRASFGPLTWRERLGILLDAAQGLDYLHNGCNPKIIHRDVKSSNILLNDKREGKVADFGISRPTSENSGDFTVRVMGTKGYLDPEYSVTFNLTEKSDVYSFGVVMFEVICGRPPFIANASHSHILQWVRPSIERGLVQDIVDASIHVEDYNVSSLWKVVEIAMMCVEYYSKRRPMMSEVCLELKEANRIEIESSRNTSQKSIDLSKDFPLSFSLTDVRIR